MSDYAFKVAENAQPADFIVENLNNATFNVSSFIPAIYEAYVRVFHPAYKVNPESRVAISWSEVARQTQRTPHKQMQWHQIRGEEPIIHDYTTLRAEDTWFEAPEEGHLPLDIARVLWQILARHTLSRTCYFAIWEGFGCLPKIVFDAPRFVIPGREFRLFQGSIEMIEQTFCTNGVKSAQAMGVIVAVSSKKPTQAEISEALTNFDNSSLPIYQQSANLWWPEDKTWCVATEIDFNSTLVGGSAEAIGAILSNEVLEVYEVAVSDTLGGSGSVKCDK